VSRNKTENVRTRRTRKLLREALVELIDERGFDRVTVGEITERALVSRAAFYRNYRDKYHLVEEVFEEAFGAVVGTMSEEGEDEGGATSHQDRWAGFFEHISSYHRLYGALLGRRGSGWFADSMRATLAEVIKAHFPESATTESASPGRGPGAPGLAPTVLAGMFVQAIMWWLENDRPIPPGEIAARTARMASAVITEVNSWP